MAKGDSGSCTTDPSQCLRPPLLWLPLKEDKGVYDKGLGARLGETNVGDSLLASECGGGGGGGGGAAAPLLNCEDDDALPLAGVVVVVGLGG